MDTKKRAMFDSIEREYRYRHRLYFLWSATTFFGLMSGLAVYFALTNSDPVYLQGVLEFPAALANIGSWFAGALFACLFAWGLVFVIQALTRRQRIALTSSALLVPKGFWSSGDQAIPYHDIVELVPHTEPDRSLALIVRHRQGKFPISESLLPSKAAFQELWGALAGRVADGRPAQGSP